MTRVLIASDIHYCELGWFGLSRDEKAENFCADLQAEYEKQPYEALLLLGDYSLDHWFWNTKGTYLTQGISNTKLFIDRYLSRAVPEGVEVRMIAGNHEQYGEELYKELTGFNRRDHLICGNTLFILTDTFGGDLDPTEHSDGTYIGANVDDITRLMAKYPNKNVILCAHWFDMDKESDRQKVLQTLKDAMRDDHTRSHVFGFTHLGLVELTRKKTGRSIGDTLKVTCPYCQGEAKVLSPYTVFNRLRKQTLQVLKGCKLQRIYIEVSPDVAAAMEELMKKDGELFPEARDADFYVKANAALHMEKFAVKPLPDKRVAEAKKSCRIMH